MDIRIITFFTVPLIIACLDAHDQKQQRSLMRTMTIYPSAHASSDDSASMLQLHSRVKSVEEGRSGLAELAEYYVGRHSQPRPGSIGPSDREILQSHGRVERLHPTHVSSLLGANHSALDTGHPKRFFADGVLSEEACKSLRAMFDRHAPEMMTSHNDFKADAHFKSANENSDFLASTMSNFVDDEDFPLLLALRQTMRDAVESHLDPKATSEFTHFIKRKGHSTNEGMGTHADNCQYHEDGLCHTSAQCCAWRSHTAFVYLSDDDVSGGEFYIARSSPDAIKGRREREDIELFVQPRCGQMVGFSSGGENLHGVLPLTSGSRYALGLWLTEDPNHFESVP